MSEGPIFKRGELVGKQVIANDAKVIGIVKDVAFDSGGRPGFVVEQKAGGEAFIFTSQIIALGDVLLVRSKHQCPKCGNVNKETAKFCIKCGAGL